MADNDQLLKQIGNLIDQKLEPVKKDLQDVKQSQAHTNSALEAVKAGQDDLIEKVANLPTRPEFQDFRASVGRKLQDHENRIEELEKDADIPHPHKRCHPELCVKESPRDAQRACISCMKPHLVGSETGLPASPRVLISAEGEEPRIQATSSIRLTFS